MGRYGNLDYPTLTRRGFALGVVLLAIGALGELVGPIVLGPLPGWEQSLLFDLEVLGVVLGLVTPFVFGILLPLTE